MPFRWLNDLVKSNKFFARKHFVLNYKLFVLPIIFIILFTLANPIIMLWFNKLSSWKLSFESIAYLSC